MNKDILRLNIPMDDVLDVHESKPLTNLLHITGNLPLGTLFSIVLL